jgi:hypothetical protein
LTFRRASSASDRSIMADKSSVKSESSTFPAGLVAGVSEAFRSVKGLAWAQALSGLAVR